MIDRNELQYVYNLTESYAQTALYFGISRQRIHQLITGYKTIYNSMNKSLQRELMLRGTTCEKCKESKFKHIHHIDGNSRNNATQNLIKVCKPCHNALHTGIEHKSKYRGKICMGGCGRTIGIDTVLAGKYCKSCQTAIRRRIPNYKRQVSFNIESCGICNIKIEKYKHARGCCHRCYSTWRYLFDPRYRENQRRSRLNMLLRMNTK